MICWGKVNCLPCREKNALALGFQNPLTPSYFSNSHLKKKQITRQREINSNLTHQSFGSARARVKKLALLGSPMPGIVRTRLSKDPGGGLSGVGEAMAKLSSVTFNRNSGRACFMHSAKLYLIVNICYILDGKIIRYLSTFPSHQKGMVINWMPFAAASFCLSLSLACICSAAEYTFLKWERSWRDKNLSNSRIYSHSTWYSNAKDRDGIYKSSSK